jgi:hypothetical protein
MADHDAWPLPPGLRHRIVVASPKQETPIMPFLALVIAVVSLAMLVAAVIATVRAEAHMGARREISFTHRAYGA